VYNAVSGFRSQAALAPTAQKVWLPSPAFALVPLSLVVTAIWTIRRDDAARPFWWGLVLLLSAGLTAYPRFGTFHLQPVLPLLAWLSVVTLSEVCLRVRHLTRTFRWGAVGVVTTLWVWWGSVASPAYLPVFDSKTSPVAEYSNLIPLAEVVGRHLSSGDRLMVFPDDEATANLYDVLERLPPDFWVMSYPWFMVDDVRSRLIRDLQADPPEWFVYFPGRWNIEAHAPDILAVMERDYVRFAALHWADQQGWLLRRRP